MNRPLRAALTESLKLCELTLVSGDAVATAGSPAGFAVEIHNNSPRPIPGLRETGGGFATLGAKVRAPGSESWIESPCRGFLESDLPPESTAYAGIRLDATEEGDHEIELSLVLESVAWQSNVAPDGVVRTRLNVTPPGSSRTLNLGCGARPIGGAVNLDCVALPGVDVVADLDDTPWPFEDSGFDQVIAFDVFEHIEDPLAFMAEAHRLLAPGGVLKLHTNYWKTEGSYTDPTHRRFCTSKTFDYWVAGTPLYERYTHYNRGCGFTKSVVAVDGEDLYFELRKPVSDAQI